MSNQGKAPICRQTYFNYGSYLRARDNEKQLCTVITEIENGTIVPYIVSHGGDINGNLTVKGNLTVTGNFVVNGSITYAGDIVLGSTCSDTIAIKGTSTFECPVASIDIDGGTIDGTVIGGSSANVGTFTTLNVDSLIASVGASIPDIGSSAPGTGNFTEGQFQEVFIKQSGAALTQPVFKVESHALATNVPSVTVSSGAAPDLFGKSSNVCGVINHVGLAGGATLTLTFGAIGAPTRPSVQITINGPNPGNESLHLSSVSALGFVITNTAVGAHTGEIHYFVVDIGV
jgi:hypothetical protein